MHTYPADVKEFIEKNVKGITSSELTERINSQFGTTYGCNHIRAYMKNHGLTNGLNTQFKKGHISHNKGMRGICAPGCEKGWFKKGCTPINHKHVGSERTDKDGYTWIKVAEPRTWKFKHRVIWEQHHGEIPNTHAVIFLDGNKQNLDINNLALITRNELKIMNRQGLRSEYAHITETGILIAKLTDKRNKSIKKK